MLINMGKIPAQSGLSFVEVLILTSIMSVVSLGVAAMMASNSKSQKNSALIYNVDQVRRNLNSLISNNQNWQSTLLKNSQTADPSVSGSTLSCLQPSYGVSKPNCTNNGTYPFKIYTAG